MEALLKDLRYGLRMLYRSPGFAAAVIVAIALGIGANTAMFSVINAVLLRPLPFSKSNQIVRLWSVRAKNPSALAPLSYPDFIDYQAQNHVFENVAAYRAFPLTLSDGTDAVRVSGISASPNFFALLGVSPVLGRVFASDEYATSEGSPPVILNEAFWRARYTGDPHVLGRTLKLNDRTFIVIGVVSARYQFPIQAQAIDVWTTIGRDTTPGTLATQRGAHYLQAIARIKPGVPLPQAQAEMSAIAGRLAQQFPDTNAAIDILLRPEFEQLVSNFRISLLLLFGATTFVLLIVCVNVANLLIARASIRGSEMALRFALGAGRARIVRQLLTESMVLGLFGGTIGVILARIGISGIIGLSPVKIPRISQVSVDGSVLLFSLVSSVAVAILVGVIPAVRFSARTPSELLQQAARSITEGTRQRRVVGVLVVCEVALTMVLLVGAGLFIESLQRLTAVNPGFNSNRILSFRISLPRSRYPNEGQSAFWERICDRLKVIPGTSSVAAVYPLPLSGDDLSVGFEVEGHPVSLATMPVAITYVVTPGYFKTMGIPLVQGRDFTELDRNQSTPVVIVNQTVARQIFNGEYPIGKHIRPGIGSSGEPPMREIVGVMGDVRSQSLNKDPIPEVYIPVSQLPMGALALVLRVERDPQAMVVAARQKVKELDKELPLYDVTTMEEYFTRSLAEPRFNSYLLGLLAGLALMLTAIGIYGVMAQMVSQRKREMSIRLALGAQKQEVLRLVVLRGVMLTAIGVAIGATGVVVLSHLVTSFLFGIRANDPGTFAAVSLLLVAIGLAGSYVPARSILSLDPAVTLREQ